jgi:hypothetical protein
MKLTQAARATRQQVSDLQTPPPISDSHQHTANLPPSAAKRVWPVAVVILGLLCSIAWMGFLAGGVIWLLFFRHS